MLHGVSFCARPGKEAELEALLSDPETGRRFAQAMGATRNTLLWQGGRMVRVLEFPDAVQPVPMARLAAQDEKVAAFLARLGRLTDPPLDPHDPASLAAFDAAAALRVVYDVRV